MTNKDNNKRIMTNKYSSGKIYKIESDVGDKIYIGSTVKKLLCDRMTGHRYDYKKWKNGDKQRIYKLYSILDKFQELRTKKLIKQKTYNRKRCRVQAKLQNLIDELHYKTIAFLTKNYTSILLPSFETQDMVRSKKLHSKVKRDLMNLAFYKFKQRLEHKCKLLKHCNVTIVNEAYTSQTCGLCGNLKKTSEKIIKCDKCEHIFDRDVNGSRNIYLKYISC